MRIECPHCQAINTLGTEDLGREISCGHCSEVVQAPDSYLTEGVVFGDFVIREQLVKRSHETDFLCDQLSLGRPAVVKVIDPELCLNEDFVTEFFQCARQAARLFHPKICPIYLVSHEDGIYYLAREAGFFGTCENLKQNLLIEGVMEWREALGIIADVAEALDFAWNELGLVHFNLKPDYIMVSKDGQGRLADIGFFSALGLSPGGSHEGIIGTPQYIAPERIAGTGADNRSDLYSLGICFYFMITGEFPFNAPTSEEIIAKHLHQFPGPANHIVPEIPGQVCSIIDMLLDKNPDSRYQSGAMLIEDLRAVADGGAPPSAVRGGNVAPVAVVAAPSPRAPAGQERGIGAGTSPDINKGTLKIQVDSEPSAAIKVARPVEFPGQIAVPVARVPAPAPPPPKPTAYDPHSPIPAITGAPAPRPPPAPPPAPPPPQSPDKKKPQKPKARAAGRSSRIKLGKKRK